jgi:hypothetical protein
MKRVFYIDYPQEHYEGQAHRYRCAYCKLETTKINGRLDGHLATCEYRVALEKAGFEADNARPNLQTIDEDD